MGDVVELITAGRDRTRAVIRDDLLRYFEACAQAGYEVSSELVGEDEAERQRVVARWWIDLGVVLTELASEVTAKAAALADELGVR